MNIDKPTRKEIERVLEKGREARTWAEYWSRIDEAVELTLLVVDADPEELAEQFDEALGHKLNESPAQFMKEKDYGL